MAVDFKGNALKTSSSVRASKLIGGSGHTISTDNTSICAGTSCSINYSCYNSAIGGGQSNTIQATYSGFLGAGYSNYLYSNRSAIVSGNNNEILSWGGSNNFIGAGDGNAVNTINAGTTASSNSCIVAGVNSDILGGIGCFIGAGSGNVIGNAGGSYFTYYTVICGGQSNVAADGYTPVNHASILGGGSNEVRANYSSIIGGKQAKSRIFGEVAHAAGNFSAIGDAQHSTFVLRVKTTNATATEMAVDGSTSRLSVPSGTILSGTVNIVGSKSDGAAVARYLRQFTIKNVGGTTSLVGSVITLGTDNAASTSISITANNTNDFLSIQVTGIASETWRWVAVVDAIRMSYGT